MPLIMWRRLELQQWLRTTQGAIRELRWMKKRDERKRKKEGKGSHLNQEN